MADTDIVKGEGRNNNCAQSAQKIFTTPTFPSWPCSHDACDRTPIEQKRWFSTFLVSFCRQFHEKSWLEGLQERRGAGGGLGLIFVLKKPILLG